MAKLRNLNMNNEALAGVTVSEAAEISIIITSSATAEDNKFKKDTDIVLTANVTADGNTGLAYKWYKDSEEVGTAETLNVKVGEDTKGDYKCKVTATYDDGDKEKESDVFTIDIAEDSSSGGSTEPTIGNRTLNEHLRMRLLGYI